MKAYLHKVSKDKDGEITIILKVSATEAKDALNIPTDKILDVEINAEV